MHAASARRPAHLRRRTASGSARWAQRAAPPASAACVCGRPCKARGWAGAPLQCQNYRVLAGWLPRDGCSSLAGWLAGWLARWLVGHEPKHGRHPHPSPRAGCQHIADGLEQVKRLHLPKVLCTGQRQGAGSKGSQHQQLCVRQRQRGVCKAGRRGERLARLLLRRRRAKALGQDARPPGSCMLPMAATAALPRLITAATSSPACMRVGTCSMGWLCEQGCQAEPACSDGPLRLRCMILIGQHRQLGGGCHRARQAQQAGRQQQAARNPPRVASLAAGSAASLSRWLRMRSACRGRPANMNSSTASSSWAGKEGPASVLPTGRQPSRNSRYGCNRDMVRAVLVPTVLLPGRAGVQRACARAFCPRPSQPL